MRRVTGAVVLMGVAVSAVTGCVTVRGEVNPRSSDTAGPSEQEAVPRKDGGARPRMGRPSAREALSRPEPRPAGAGQPDRSEETGGPVAPAGGAAPPPAGEDGAADSADTPPGGPVQPPLTLRSPAVPELPGGPGVCDLGRRYGGWAEGSMPEATCERAYDG